MTAATLLVYCRRLGINLEAGPHGTLIWEADTDPPADLLLELASKKREVLRLLNDPMEAFCRELETEKGLPPGSVFWWRPGHTCRCGFCKRYAIVS